MLRRTLLGAISAGALAAMMMPTAFAHHGLMIWDTENPITIEGIVSAEMDGFPHWEVSIRVDGKDWIVDLGSDFDLERAGLSSDGREFTIGSKIIVTGYRTKSTDVRLMRPATITLDGKLYKYTTDWD